MSLKVVPWSAYVRQTFDISEHSWITRARAAPGTCTVVGPRGGCGALRHRANREHTPRGRRLFARITSWHSNLMELPYWNLSTTTTDVMQQN